MDKVIKVTEDEIFIGREDGSVLKTDRVNASWDVKVGDVVDVFSSDNMIILNLAKKTKVKTKKNFNFEKLFQYCKKLLPIIFSSLFAAFMIALIVVCSVPRGKEYTFSDNVWGIDYSCSATFSKDELIIKSYAKLGNEVEDTITTFEYKITYGTLYVYNEETATAELIGSFEISGKISSTKLELSDIEIEGFNIILKEKTMCALRNTFITFMVIFGILDLACLAIIILTKKGIIKTNEQSNNENKIAIEDKLVNEVKAESVVEEKIIEKPKSVKSLEEYFEDKK